jgi:Flp pilus assembly protein TadG
MHPSRRYGSNRWRRRRRIRGTAAVELAVCLPILLTIVWMTVIACELIHLRHTLTLAAYEGARTAIVKDAVNDDVIDAANWVLDSRGVAPLNRSVAIYVADITQVVPGTYITVTTTADTNANMPLRGFTNGTMQVSAQMMKEY